MNRFICVALVAALGAPVAAAAQTAPGGFTGFRGEIRGGYDDLKIGGLRDNGFDDKADGVLYGAGVGYDFDLGSAVVGLEGNLDFSSAKVTISDATAVGRIKAKRDFEAAVRAGFKLGDNALLYGKVGYTNLRIQGSIDDLAGGDDFALSGNADGWRVGGGLEYLFGGGTYGKVEYRYSDYQGDIKRNQVVGAVGFRF